MDQGKGVGNNTEKKFEPKIKRKYMCKLGITINLASLLNQLLFH